MKSNRNCRTADAASSPWPIPVRIRMDRNCKASLIHNYNVNIYIMSIPHPRRPSFITYRSCRNLDGKHTIFGKVVGGLETLNEMEKIEVDNRDRPIEEIVLQQAEVFVDPFKEADEQLAEQRAAVVEEQRQRAAAELKQKQRAQPVKVFRQGVGKYLDKTASGTTTPAATAANSDEPTAAAKKAKRSTDYRFKDFSSW